MAHLAAHTHLLTHYPEPEAWSLEAMIARHHGISEEQVIVTSGATDAIYLIAQTFRAMQPHIPEPTFSEYGDACYHFVDGGLKHRLNTIWLCNPNNPTGHVYDQPEVDSMMAKYDLVVLDHSYEHYTDAHLMSPRWGCLTPYTIQIHSMTKTYAVPGLRLGYITAHESLTRQIRRQLRPWNVSALAIEAGKFLLQHDELICRPDLSEARRLCKQLSQFEDLTIMPSETNFMLCRLARHTAAELKEYLALQHHMLIRDASNFGGLTPHHFRIAAQTPQQNDALVDALSQFLS